MSLWKRIATARGDAGTREALGAVLALAKQGEKTGDARFYREILDVLQDEMLPKVKDGPPILAPVAYGRCEDEQCKGKRDKRDVRGLFAIGGARICIGCRKRRYAELRASGVKRYWEHESVKVNEKERR